MRQALTKRERSTLERVPEAASQNFLEQLWLNRAVPKRLPSWQTVVFSVLHILVFVGLLSANPGLHDVSVFFTVVFSGIGFLLTGIALVWLIALTSDQGDEKKDEKALKSNAESITSLITGDRSILITSRFRFWRVTFIDVAFWAVLVYTGHPVIAALVMISDALTRLFVSSMRAHLMTEGIALLREVEEASTN